MVVEVKSNLAKKSDLEINFVEKEYKVDIMYVNELEGLRMIVDSGAPM